MRILLIVLVLMAGCAEKPKGINLDTLEERSKVYYTINTNDPYTGAIFGLYESGEKEFEGYLKDGKFDGKMTHYNENGKISDEVNFKDGKFDGKWTFYNEDGSIHLVVEYKNGVRVY